MNQIVLTFGSLIAVAATSIHEWGVWRGVGVTCAIWLLMPQQQRI